MHFHFNGSVIPLGTAVVSIGTAVALTLQQVGEVTDWSSLARLLPEVALVAIFVWYASELSKRSDAHDIERSKIHAAAVDSLTAAFLKQLEQRDAMIRMMWSQIYRPSGVEESHFLRSSRHEEELRT